MTDEFDRLRAALKAPPPVPEADAKARAQRHAMENFDRHQETAKAARPMSDRPERAGFLTGVREMLSRLTTGPALAATVSVAAIGVAIAIYPQLDRQPAVPKPLPATMKDKTAPTEVPAIAAPKAERRT